MPKYNENYKLGYKVVSCPHCDAFRDGNTERCPNCHGEFFTPEDDSNHSKIITLLVEDVLALDNRIKWAKVENSTRNNPGFYCKIGFHWEHNGEIATDGKIDFTATSKDEIFRLIKQFLNNKGRGYEIV